MVLEGAISPVKTRSHFTPPSPLRHQPSSVRSRGSNLPWRRHPGLSRGVATSTAPLRTRCQYSATSPNSTDCGKSAVTFSRAVAASSWASPSPNVSTFAPTPHTMPPSSDQSAASARA